MTHVWLTVGQNRIEAQVVLASENGRSLFLEFEGSIQLNERCTVVGALAVLRKDDGHWIDLVTSTRVNIEPFTKKDELTVPR